MLRSFPLPRRCNTHASTAVFNVVVGNRDDHLRNHGFLRGQGGWHLAPAFDVNPNPDRDEQEVLRAFDDWQETARSVGIPRMEIERLSAALDPERALQ